jgi:NADH-quinone oxidoreductase subunit J
MLFGVTVIGAKFPEEKGRPWAVASIILIAIGFFVIPFIMPAFSEVANAGTKMDQVKVLTDHYAEVTIFLAVVGASLLYGSIRMLHTLKHEKEVS